MRLEPTLEAAEVVERGKESSALVIVELVLRQDLVEIRERLAERHDKQHAPARGIAKEPPEDRQRRVDRRWRVARVRYDINALFDTIRARLTDILGYPRTGIVIHAVGSTVRVR
jgi:hypothetical protein